MSETKPRDVQILPIGTDTIVLRSRSWARLRFEIEYALAKGTTANSYLIHSALQINNKERSWLKNYWKLS
jgi:flavorubredoxin